MTIFLFILLHFALYFSFWWSICSIISLAFKCSGIWIVNEWMGHDYECLLSRWAFVLSYYSLEFRPLILTFWFSDQLKEAVLSGVALEDEKKDQFNKIQQVLSFLNFLIRLLFILYIFSWLEAFPEALVEFGGKVKFLGSLQCVW